MTEPMRFGTFMSPIHPARGNPTLALERDLELVEHLDRLGYEEAWFGEHHSGGWEIIASPDLVVATAAARTHRIKLGTGVISIPYHHPMMVADRMVLLDHLTRGRAIFGVGPGALPSDSHMLGLDPREQRRMLVEGMEAVVSLLAGETVTVQTDWFELHDARLQLLPYSHPRMEIVVAVMTSTSGPELAGLIGAEMISIGATHQRGFDVLANHWRALEETCSIWGNAPDRSTWRLVGPMHIAPTEEQARAEVAFGLEAWTGYFQRVAALPISADGDSLDEIIDNLNSSGLAVIGTPAMAIAQIERLQRQTGGFGKYILMAHEWAEPAANLRSYELFAEQVFPRFQGSTEARVGSEEWVAANRPELIAKAKEAVIQAIRKQPAGTSGGGR